MAYGSLGQFLPLKAAESALKTSTSPDKSPNSLESRQRHRSLADVCSSVLDNYDNSTDSGLYRPKRRDIAHSLQLVDTSFTTPHKATKAIRLPGYREIPSRVGSFRPRQRVTEESTDLSKLRELELRNEMMLAAHHDVLRTMKRELRRRQADQPKATLSDQFQERLQLRMHQLTHPQDTRPLWKCEGRKLFQKPQLLPSPEANQRSQSVYTQRWSSARGHRPVQTSLQGTCKALFELVDVKDKGQVDRGKLVWTMLAIGVRVDPQALLLSLGRYLGAKYMLDFTQFTRYVCDKTALVRAIQRLVPQASPLPQITSLISYLESEFQRLFAVWELITATWKALDPSQTGKAEADQAAKHLVKLGLAVEIGAGQRLAKRLSGGAKWLSKDDFVSFFIRPLVKLHLEVLDKGMRDWNKAGEGGSQWLAELTRTVIMSGLQYRPERCSYADSVVERLQTFDKEQYANYAEYRAFIAAFLAPTSTSKPALEAEELPAIEPVTASTMPSDPSFHLSPKQSPASPYIQRPKSTRTSCRWSEPGKVGFAFKSSADERRSPDPALGLFLS